MIYFKCVGCGKRLQIDDQWAGKSGSCPYCKAISPVPGPQQQTNTNRIGFVCSGCGAQLNIGREWAGKLGNCPYCGVNSPVPVTNTPVPAGPRRSSKLGILARLVAWPVIGLTGWIILFFFLGMGDWILPFIVGGFGSVFGILFIYWALMQIIMWIWCPREMKLWKSGGGDPFFDTLPPPFNNDPDEVKYQELFRERLRLEEEGHNFD